MSEVLMQSLIVIGVSALPVSELRGGIPLALNHFHMSAGLAFVLAVIGNLIPVIPLLLLLGKVTDMLRKYEKMDRFFAWLFQRTREKHGGKLNRYGAMGLILLVAIPLPATGAWTGTLAAYLFGIEFRKAFPLITIGVLIAAVVVTLANLGIINFLNLLANGGVN